jgi:hypothetical protein
VLIYNESSHGIVHWIMWDNCKSVIICIAKSSTMDSVKITRLLYKNCITQDKHSVQREIYYLIEPSLDTVVLKQKLGMIIYSYK